MISEEQYKLSALIVGCEVAAIKAVAKVESKGAGFDDKGRVKILFEPHVFWAQLEKVRVDPKKHLDRNADILSKKWNALLYNVGGSQYEKLTRAIAIHEEAALKSCSWGMFQIMGFNYINSGYPNIHTMVHAFQALGEGEHLRAVSNLIVAEGWAKFLKNKEWEKFAEKYNGPGYKQNNYHTKLSQAYAEFKK